jgi:hypothetical protein
MKSSERHTIHHKVVILLFVIGLFTIPAKSQLSESAVQQGKRGTRQLTEEEAGLLLNGIKKVYGIDPESSKLRVAEGTKAESVNALELGGVAEGGATCSYSLKGDVASGVIIAEDKNMVYIDARPCELKLYSFHKPYTKTKVGTVDCKGKVLDRYAITQH